MSKNRSNPPRPDTAELRQWQRDLEAQNHERLYRETWSAEMRRERRKQHMREESQAMHSPFGPEHVRTPQRTADGGRWVIEERGMPAVWRSRANPTRTRGQGRRSNPSMTAAERRQWEKEVEAAEKRIEEMKRHMQEESRSGVWRPMKSKRNNPRGPDNRKLLGYLQISTHIGDLSGAILELRGAGVDVTTEQLRIALLNAGADRNPVTFEWRVPGAVPPTWAYDELQDWLSRAGLRGVDLYRAWAVVKGHLRVRWAAKNYARPSEATVLRWAGVSPKSKRSNPRPPAAGYWRGAEHVGKLQVGRAISGTGWQNEYGVIHPTREAAVKTSLHRRRQEAKRARGQIREYVDANASVGRQVTREVAAQRMGLRSKANLADAIKNLTGPDGLFTIANEAFNEAVAGKPGAPGLPYAAYRYRKVLAYIDALQPRKVGALPPLMEGSSRYDAQLRVIYRGAQEQLQSIEEMERERR